MSRLYPTLEDMRVDQLQTAQINHERQAIGAPQAQYPNVPPQGQYPPAPLQYPQQTGQLIYPSLTEYMGLEFTPEIMQVVASQGLQVGVRQTQSGQTQIAPITGNNLALARSEIKSGIREVVLCKDGEGKLGLRIRHVNNGLFVALVQAGSPAALAGLRFGDQILQINGKTVAGWDNDKAHNFLKKVDGARIDMAVRDRPFERTITMQKDSNGYVGFVFKDGRIKSLVKESSAARNGVLTDHQLIEVGGQNVVGLKDKEISEIIDSCGRTLTITVMPCFVYDHIVKCMGNSIVKKLMDHSIPDL
ncbi:syntenin-1-like isoform X1 [Biomphalaria pfeifferi]|uniref:Syntenin-1-like isoform X1 n=1 Tax=Biomphalaria pfeifferi TaxID=112525 RepID=A0AAD8C1R7_BIOPF|nr:syntenin-1-like isoform X1 [Biomphalaria pfeifferi]